jgi:hypothetical protein
LLQRGVRHADDAFMIDQQQIVRSRLDNRLQEKLVAPQFLSAAFDKLLKTLAILLKGFLAALCVPSHLFRWP